MSTLYSGDEESMALAIAFTEQAASICALGPISTLSETERYPGESASQYNVRLASLAPKKLAYVAATLQAITRGCSYRRIMDFSPRSDSLEHVRELLANVNFFVRAYDTPCTKTIDLQLYHSSQLMSDRGDFHFRVSDRQLVLRVGGHGNGYANAALLLTDTRALDEYRRYFESLLVSPATRPVSYEDLQLLRDRLLAGDLAGASRVLRLPEKHDLLEPLAGAAERASTVDPREVGLWKRGQILLPETAVVMAAGRGARMGDLTEDHQKCMLPVGGRPLLGWVLEALADGGVSRILVLAGYRSDEVGQYAKDLRLRAAVEVVRVTPSSTAAALTEVHSNLGDHFWYLHGNILFPRATLNELRVRYYDLHHRHNVAPAAILCAVKPSAGLTHAILRKQSPETASVLFASRAEPKDRPSVDLRNDILSLGLGIMNNACIDWHRAGKESLMAEALIESTPDHPLIFLQLREFLHVETKRDYDRLKDNSHAVQDVMGNRLGTA